MQLHQRWWSGTAIVLALLAGSVTQADEADDARKREALKDEINRHLEAIASGLRGVSSSSSGEDAIERTRAEVESVKSKAGTLRDLARDDSTARRMADYYPGYADKYREAAGYLKQMRQSQKHLDELPQLCETRDKELEDKIRRYVERNDPKGTEEIPKLAQEYGKPIHDRLNDADRKRAELQSARDRAKYFSESDGKWSDVRSNLASSADQIYEHFNGYWERARKQCNELNKLEKHPAAERAIAMLGQGEKGRQELYQQLDRKLEEITRALTEAARDADTSEVDRAINLANDLQSSIERLQSVKGEDRRAGEMATSWPRYISAFRETAKQLKILKEGQRRADPLPEKCAHMKVALDGVIKQFERDPNGIDDIEKLAREQASTLTTSAASNQAEDARMQSARSAISGFSLGEGKWRDVSDAMKRTSEAVFGYWKDALKKTQDACAALVLGEKNPAVIAAIKALVDHAGGAIDGYQKEVAAWRERVRVYKRRDCDEMTRLWEALCGPLDYEPNEPEDKATAWALSDQIVRGLLPGVADLLKEYDIIKRQGDELQKKAKTRDEATRILASLTEDHTKLLKLQIKTGWTGSNNPLIQFYISYGVQQHNVMMGDSSYSCDARDVTYYSNKRPDCVSGSHCTVFEFKPNNSIAISAGTSKLGSTYVPEATRYYQQHLDDRKVPDSDHGGSEIMRKLAGKCLDGSGKIVLKGEVRTYNRCERQYECTQ